MHRAVMSFHGAGCLSQSKRGVLNTFSCLVPQRVQHVVAAVQEEDAVERLRAGREAQAALTGRSSAIHCSTVVWAAAFGL